MQQTPQQYLASQLSSGLTLSHIILRDIDWDQGQFALIHSNRLTIIQKAMRMDFSTGTLLTTTAIRRTQPDGKTATIQLNDRASKSRSILAELLYFVVHSTVRDEHWVQISEDVLFGRDELDNKVDEEYYLGNEVYLATFSPSKKGEIETVLRYADGQWRTMGFLSTLEQYKVGNTKELSNDLLINISSTVAVMYSQALDREGYVLWFRKQWLQRLSDWAAGGGNETSGD